MAQLEVPYPDGEDVVMAILDPAISPATQRMLDDTERPVSEVRQTGGQTTALEDKPVIQVSYCGRDYAEAKRMAKEGTQLILAAARTRVPNVAGEPNGVYVDRTAVEAPSRETVQLDHSDGRRKTASYRLVMRRPPSF